MEGRPSRDDRVLPVTRALSAFIVPFLLVAFVVLYGFPSDTGRLFAWKIKPTMTPMTLGAVYLGGSYFSYRRSGPPTGIPSRRVSSPWGRSRR